MAAALPLCAAPAAALAGPSPFPPDASLEVDAGRPGERVEVVFSDSGAHPRQQYVNVRSPAFESDDVVLGFTGRKYIGSAHLRRDLEPGRYTATVTSVTNQRKATLETRVEVMASASKTEHGFLEGTVAGTCGGAAVTLAAVYLFRRRRTRT